MKQNQFKFKPFDKVLVRDINGNNWKTDIFSHLNEYHDDTNTVRYSTYCCVTGNWEQCIPYNENTAHLVGTNEPYKPQQKQEKKIHVWTSGTFNEWMTEDEFKNFINTAVLNNKDITDFHVLYIR